MALALLAVAGEFDALAIAGPRRLDDRVDAGAATHGGVAAGDDRGDGVVAGAGVDGGLAA